MLKYEYKLARYYKDSMFAQELNEETITQKINLMATHGWQVESFSVQTDWGREKSALVLFKREKLHAQ